MAPGDGLLLAWCTALLALGLAADCCLLPEGWKPWSPLAYVVTNTLNRSVKLLGASTAFTSVYDGAGFLLASAATLAALCLSPLMPSFAQPSPRGKQRAALMLLGSLLFGLHALHSASAHSRRLEAVVDAAFGHLGEDALLLRSPFSARMQLGNGLGQWQWHALFKCLLHMCCTAGQWRALSFC